MKTKASITNPIEEKIHNNNRVAITDRVLRGSLLMGYILFHIVTTRYVNTAMTQGAIKIVPSIVTKISLPFGTRRMFLFVIINLSVVKDNIVVKYTRFIKQIHSIDNNNLSGMKR